MPPDPIRRMLRRTLRAGLRAARRGPLTRPLSRIAYHPAAARWCAGREVVGWRGVNVAIDPGEAHGFHVYFLGEYARREIDACVALARDARWFADIGANIGLVTLAVSRAVPGLQVMAVEPDAALCDRLWFNLSLNPDLAPRVHVVQAAATDRDGPVRFEPSPTALNHGVGHLVTTGPGTSGAIDVSGIAVGAAADRLGRALDVVKIDVEGGELAALRGIWTSSSRPRGLVIETHGFTAADPAAFNRALIDELTSHGYAVESLGRDGWSPVIDPAAVGARGHLRAQRSDRAHA